MLAGEQQRLAASVEWVGARRKHLRDAETVLEQAFTALANSSAN
jgi:hypothetical protein